MCRRESEEFERAAAVGESSLTGAVAFGEEKVPHAGARGRG